MLALLMLAVLVAAAGLFFLSSATAGVGLIGLACFLAICARIAQAGRTAHEPEPESPIRADPPTPVTPTSERRLLEAGLVLMVIAVIIAFAFAIMR